MAGTPYYDDELEMAQSIAHMQTIFYLGSLLNEVAQAADLRVVSDNPVWYWLPEVGVQRALYPDYALTATPSVARLTAPELVLALEVVSTADPIKEKKDTVVMRDHNAAHGVPEFVLIYPEPDDARSVVWHRDEERSGCYQVVPLPADRRYRSVAIPGLALEVLPPEEWTPGRKVRVWFQGQELRDRRTETRLREAAEQQAAQEAARAEQEAARAEQERAAKEQERARAERLAERLRALGIDPDTLS
jgi:Uma2 family endonuclease